MKRMKENAGELECSKTVYRCSAFTNLFLPTNEERKRTSFEVEVDRLIGFVD